MRMLDLKKAVKQSPFPDTARAMAELMEQRMAKANAIANRIAKFKGLPARLAKLVDEIRRLTHCKRITAKDPKKDAIRRSKAENRAILVVEDPETWRTFTIPKESFKRHGIEGVKNPKVVFDTSRGS